MENVPTYGNDRRTDPPVPTTITSHHTRQHRNTTTALITTTHAGSHDIHKSKGKGKGKEQTAKPPKKTPKEPAPARKEPATKPTLRAIAVHATLAYTSPAHAHTGPRVWQRDVQCV